MSTATTTVAKRIVVTMPSATAARRNWRQR
jgi:hypothetical protein